MKYRLYVPSNYDPNKEYPVIFFLHGAGHRGTDNAAPVKGIIFNLFNHKNPQIDDAIVLVPQCPSNYQWVDWPWAKGSYSVDATPESKAMKTALELLDMVESEYSTDTDRYYAFGLSMGGFGTWDVIMRHPDRFAAAVTLCGGADPQKAHVLVDMPIWTVHSLDDTGVPVKGTQDMVKAIKDAGGAKIIYDELNGYNHSIGTLTAKRDEVFEWMFSQSK
jgi:predicted peptidase